MVQKFYEGTAFTPGQKQRGVVNRYYYRSQNDLSSLELPIWSVNPRTRVPPGANQNAIWRRHESRVPSKSCCSLYRNY